MGLGQMGEAADPLLGLVENGAKALAPMAQAENRDARVGQLQHCLLGLLEHATRQCAGTAGEVTRERGAR